MTEGVPRVAERPVIANVVERDPKLIEFDLKVLEVAGNIHDLVNLLIDLDDMMLDSGLSPAEKGAIYKARSVLGNLVHANNLKQIREVVSNMIEVVVGDVSRRDPKLIEFDLKVEGAAGNIHDLVNLLIDLDDMALDSGLSLAEKRAIYKARSVLGNLVHANNKKKD